MWKDMKFANNADRPFLIEGAALQIGNSVWVSLLQCNGLLNIDINSGRIQYIGYFEHEKNEYQLHTHMVSYENKIFFVPWNADNLAIYDMTKKELRYVFIGEELRFTAGIVHEKYLYLVVESSIKIIQFDIDAEVIQNQYELKNMVETESTWLVQPFKAENGIYRLLGKQRESWKFDFQTKRYIVWKCLCCGETELVAGIFTGNSIWVVSDDDVLYLLSTDLQCLAKYDVTAIRSRVLGNEKMEWLKMKYYDDFIVLIFYEENYIVKIPLIENVPDVNNCQFIRFDSAFFPDGDNNLVFMTDNKLAFFGQNEIREITIKLDMDFWTDMMRKREFKIAEVPKCGITLEGYMQYVCNYGEELLSNESAHVITVGKRILDIVKKE